MNAPDPRWLPFLKMVFGFLLLISLVALAAIIALGKVTQQESHGLDDILGGLLALSGGFVGWAFSSDHRLENQEKKEEEKK